MKILLIEDEKMLADSLKTMLIGKGFQVETAYDGENGAEYALLGIYDLLILDVMMPKLNGYEATKAIRSLRNHPDADTIPIIAMTANAFDEDRKAATDCGMNGFISKPINMEEVIEVLQSVLL